MAQPNWITPEGVVAQKIYSLGTATAANVYSLQLIAEPVVPAVSVTYKLISGNLPNGLSLFRDGLLIGTPSIVNESETSTFAIRATDNLGNIRDRTFSLTISGSAIPSFVTPEGQILDTSDSVWVSLQLQINNPDITNLYSVRVLQGLLPLGLEINENGLIRGYPDKPLLEVSFPQITTTTTITEDTNLLTCLSTTGFAVGRQVIFSGSSSFGAIELGQTYYIREILGATQYTLSDTPNGPTLNLTEGSGFMTTTLVATTIGQPAVRTYNFTLQLNSPNGSDIQNYSIIVRNQNLSVTQGGLGLPPNSRLPVIFNTRPETFDLNNTNPFYGYYILPPEGSLYDTYPPNIFADIGKFTNDNFFAFKVIGYDFDNDELTYSYIGLPLGFTGDTNTGWITGTPNIALNNINEYTFGVAVYKKSNPTLQSQTFYFKFIVSNDIIGEITWLTDSNLGTIDNGTVSLKYVAATSDVSLQYRLTPTSNLPPNLTLLSNGELSGYIAIQPTDTLLLPNEQTTFTFTIEAFSPLYNVIKSERTFSLTVVQEYATPTDVLYIKCTPSIADRQIIKTLLDSELSETLMPTDYLFRPEDIYFGKASDVIYEHEYGIYASDINQYIAAITKNHYWRNIILGELKTAVAKDENGNIIYEVVYSQIVDNLVNPEGVSIPLQIRWPRNINLFLGPWYTSITDIYTSYEDILGQQYYTSLTSGTARTLYPNSLINMRTRVAQELGQEPNSNILPLWMTSQQTNGSTLGFTQAWVICYTKPGYSEIIKNNINTMWKKPDGSLYKLNQINFQIDRFSVDKSLTYDYDNNTTPPAWTGLPSATPVPDPLDSQNFYVLFPRKTILPTENQ